MQGPFEYVRRAAARPETRVDWRGVNYVRILQNIGCMLAGAGILRLIQLLSR